MKKIEKFEVDFEEYPDDRPYVEVEFCDKNFKWRKGIFLVDTGASENFLNRPMKKYIGESHFRPNRIITPVGIGGSAGKFSAVDFTFYLGDEFFFEEFYMKVDEMTEPSSDDRESCEDDYYLGILGVNFLLKYKLVLDFHRYSLHSPFFERNQINKRNCHYIMDMYSDEFESEKKCPYFHYNFEDDSGVKSYVRIGLDSGGSSPNLIESWCVGESRYQRIKGRKPFRIKGEAKTINVVPIMLDFNLCSFEKNFMHEKITFHEEFGMARALYGRNGGPDAGLVSAEFMFMNRWTLDFCHGIVYRLKRFPRLPASWYAPGDQ